MSEEFSNKSHYLAPDHVRKILVRKRGWSEPLSLCLETVEISSLNCCFECNDEAQLFTIGDELDMWFDLGNDTFNARAFIQRIDRSEFLDELYEQKPMLCCCAQFEGELARDRFDRIVGTPLITRSLV